jgi:ribosomal protein RSM22 (predicted rRNA methylase)
VGFQRILAARSDLIAAGAAIAAPCPGQLPCPVTGSDWCHFLARVERSPLHRRAKAGTRSWEDEPYSYVVATRLAADPAPRAVLGRPRHGSGRVEIRICAADGRVQRRIVSRREGSAYRAARDIAWGDRIPQEIAAGLPDAANPTTSPAPSEVDDRPLSGG